MPEIGWPELLVIGLVFVLLFGTQKIPGAMKGMGEAIRGFNQTMELRRLAALLFASIDYLISPTAPVPAFAAERCSPGDDPEHPFEHICFTVPWNFTEQPAVSINAAFTKTGLPIGVQIVGRRFDDHGVLKLAKAWETARGPITNWPSPPATSSVRTSP